MDQEIKDILFKKLGLKEADVHFEDKLDMDEGMTKSKPNGCNVDHILRSLNEYFQDRIDIDSFILYSRVIIFHPKTQKSYIELVKKYVYEELEKMTIIGNEYYISLMDGMTLEEFNKSSQEYIESKQKINIDGDHFAEILRYLIDKGGVNYTKSFYMKI